MNIFEIYKENIVKILKNLSNKNILKVPENIKNIGVDIPPDKFSCDLSTNVAMVISKLNQRKPKDVANLIINELNKDDDVESVKFELPGFINIKFKKIFWTNFLINVLNNHKKYGIDDKKKKNN